MSPFLFFLLKTCAVQLPTTKSWSQFPPAASLICSAVILGRPASCKSGKTSGNYVLASMIQSTLWRQNKQEQTHSTAREMASALREGGSSMMGTCLMDRSLDTQVLEDAWNFSRLVTKPVCKACMVFIHPLPYLSGWQDALGWMVSLKYRCAIPNTLCKCISSGGNCFMVIV